MAVVGNETKDLANAQVRSQAETPAHSRIFSANAVEARTSSAETLNPGTLNQGISQGISRVGASADSLKKPQEYTEASHRFLFPKVESLLPNDFKERCFVTPKTRTQIQQERQQNCSFLHYVYSTANNYVNALSHLDPKFDLVLKVGELVNQGARVSESLVEQYARKLLWPYVWAKSLDFQATGDHLNYEFKFCNLIAFYFKFYGALQCPALSSAQAKYYSDSEILRSFLDRGSDLERAILARDSVGQYVETPFDRFLDELKRIEEKGAEPRSLEIYFEELITKRDYANADELFTVCNEFLGQIFAKSYRQENTQYFNLSSMAYLGDGLLLAVFNNLIRGAVEAGTGTETETEIGARLETDNDAKGLDTAKLIKRHKWFIRNLKAVVNARYLIENRLLFTSSKVHEPGRFLDLLRYGHRMQRVGLEALLRRYWGSGSYSYTQGVNQVNQNDGFKLWWVVVNVLRQDYDELPLYADLSLLLTQALSHPFMLFADRLLKEHEGAFEGIDKEGLREQLWTKVKAWQRAMLLNEFVSYAGNLAWANKVNGVYEVKGVSGLNGPSALSDGEILDIDPKAEIKATVETIVNHLQGRGRMVSAIKLYLNRRDAAFASRFVAVDGEPLGEVNERGFGYSLDDATYVRARALFTEPRTNESQLEACTEYLLVLDKDLNLELYENASPRVLGEEQISSVDTKKHADNFELSVKEPWCLEDYFIPQADWLKEFTYIIYDRPKV